MEKIEELKLYIVEFNEFGIIKLRVNLLGCIIEGGNQWLIILIIYNKYIFLGNIGVHKVWTWKKDIFLQSKEWR